MPGVITSVDGPFVIGEAYHPVHEKYPVVVHALLQGRVVTSVLADVDLQNGRSGFLLRLPRAYRVHELAVFIGETDEYLDVPTKGASPNRQLTVEDLIGRARMRRSWVDGSCEIDAMKAGLELETILDLICRDYLGRPVDFQLLAEIMPIASADLGSSAVRRRFLNSREYRARQMYAESAPGAIFSSSMVKAVSSRDFVEQNPNVSREIAFSSKLMLEPENEPFIRACYLNIHNRQPDRATIARYLQDLEAGQARPDVVRNMALELNRTAP